MMRYLDPYAPIRVRNARTARRAFYEAYILLTYSTPVERRWAAQHLDAIEAWLWSNRTTKPRWAILERAVRGLRADLALDPAR